MGCVIAPLTFLMFYKAFPLGVPGTAYPAPYATIYRAMAILGVEVSAIAVYSYRPQSSHLARCMCACDIFLPDYLEVFAA